MSLDFTEMLNTCLKDRVKDNKMLVQTRCGAAASREQTFRGVVGGKWSEGEHKNQMRNTAGSINRTSWLNTTYISRVALKGRFSNRRQKLAFFKAKIFFFLSVCLSVCFRLLHVEQEFFCLHFQTKKKNTSFWLHGLIHWCRWSRSGDHCSPAMAFSTFLEILQR